MKINPETRKVYTTLYTKPTDTHDYLLYSSAHPRHFKDNTPYSQLMRIRKICTRDTDFTQNAQMILGHFHRRGYPLELLQNAWEKAKNLDRVELITPKQLANTPTTSQDLFLTTTFNPASPDLKGMLTKHWDLLSIPPHNLNIDQSRIKKGYRRAPNLKEKLCSSTIQYPPKDNPNRRGPIWEPSRALKKCNNKQCDYCPYLESHGRVICHQTQRTYHAPIVEQISAHY